MLFAISPGSEGIGPDRFSAYVPFVLAPGRTLVPLDSPITTELGSQKLLLEPLHHLYAVSLGPFESESCAQQNLRKLQAALLWLSLKYKVGVSYSKAGGAVKLFDSPKPVPDKGLFAYLSRAAGWDEIEGEYEADKSVIRPEHKKLVRWETGRGTVQAGLSVENFFRSLWEAFSLPALDAVCNHRKLQLALEIYGAFTFELSENSQFLTLVTSLEALLPETEISSQAETALEAAKETVKEVRDAHAGDSASWSDTNHLLSRLGRLRIQSIGMTLRDYVSKVVKRHPDLGDPTTTSKQLKDVYTVRSKLVHDGSANGEKVREHLAFLRDFLPRLLEVLYRETASGTGSLRE